METTPSPEKPKDPKEDRDKGLTQKAFQRLRRDIKITSAILAVLILSGIATTCIALKGHASAATIWALACLGVGSIGGFLFAIPRVNRPVSPKEGEGLEQSSRLGISTQSRPRGLGTNTNLEEISDWLTKILVGLGLIELRSLPSYLHRVGSYVGQGLGHDQQSTASGIVIYFSGLGFLCGYLFTRMFVAPAFRDADEATSVGLNSEEILEIAFDAQAQSQAMPDLYDVLDATYGAIMDYRTRKVSLPNDVVASYLAELRRFEEDPRWHLNRRLHILAGVLYRQSGSLDKAIAILTKFITTKTDQGQRDIHLAAALYNRACYYALQASPDSPRSEENLKNALADLTYACAVSPSNMSDAATDPDFSVLEHNAKFRMIVGLKDDLV
jgi:tetratricopeptide (TPR) repeat protein